MQHFDTRFVSVLEISLNSRPSQSILETKLSLGTCNYFRHIFLHFQMSRDFFSPEDFDVFVFQKFVRCSKDLFRVIPMTINVSNSADFIL